MSLPCRTPHLVLLGLALLAAAANAAVVLSTRTEVTGVERVAPAQAAIVLGARVFPDGTLSRCSPIGSRKRSRCTGRAPLTGS